MRIGQKLRELVASNLVTIEENEPTDSEEQMRLGQRLRELVTSNIVGAEDTEDDFLPAPSPSPQAVSPTPAPAESVTPTPAPIAPVLAPESSPEPAASEAEGESLVMSPEAVFQMIAALPESLPLRVRRTAVRNAIQLQTKTGAELDMILGEATLKKIQLLQNQQKAQNEFHLQFKGLEARIAELTRQREALEERYQAETHTLAEGVHQMDQVIQFLGADISESEE